MLIEYESKLINKLFQDECLINVVFDLSLNKGYITLNSWMCIFSKFGCVNFLFDP